MFLPTLSEIKFSGKLETTSLRSNISLHGNLEIEEK